MDCSTQGSGSQKSTRRCAKCTQTSSLRRWPTTEVIASTTLQSRFMCGPSAKSVALDIPETKKIRTSYCQSNVDTEEPSRRLGRKSVISDSDSGSEEEATRPAKRTRTAVPPALTT
jgi:hypothetical protein